MSQPDPHRCCGTSFAGKAGNPVRFVGLDLQTGRHRPRSAAPESNDRVSRTLRRATPENGIEHETLGGKHGSGPPKIGSAQDRDGDVRHSRPSIDVGQPSRLLGRFDHCHSRMIGSSPQATARQWPCPARYNVNRPSWRASFQRGCALNPIAQRKSWPLCCQQSSCGPIHAGGENTPYTDIKLKDRS